MRALRETGDGGLIFTNLVDFDTEFGHRRDVAGYAACLEAFDRRLPEIEAALRASDFCVVTADHGNDPTFAATTTRASMRRSSAFGGVKAGPIGERASFADIAETMARQLGLPKGPRGASWL